MYSFKGLIIVIFYLLFREIITEYNNNDNHFSWLYGILFYNTNSSNSEKIKRNYMETTYNPKFINKDDIIKQFNYNDINNNLNMLSRKYSDIMRLYSKKSSDKLLCGNETCIFSTVQLTDFSILRNDTPEILIHSGLHGDERLSVTISMELIESLCLAYKRNDLLITYLLKNRSIWIIPMANSWGYYYNFRLEIDVDPNRDFPYNVDRDISCLRGEVTRYIYDLYNEHLFQLGIAIHSGLKSISYGWGSYKHSILKMGKWKAKESPDNKAFMKIANALQISSSYMLGSYPNNIFRTFEFFYKEIGPLTDIVYPVHGGFEDWSYGYSWDTDKESVNCSRYFKYPINLYSGRCLTFLLETDMNKDPNPIYYGLKSDIISSEPLESLRFQPALIPRNVRLILRFIELAKPDILFLSRSPKTVYPGQSFLLCIALIGCLTYNNLKIKLINSRDKKEPDIILYEKNDIINNKCTKLPLNKDIKDFSKIYCSETFEKGLNEDNNSDFRFTKFSNIINKTLKKIGFNGNITNYKSEDNSFSPIIINLTIPNNIIDSSIQFKDFRFVIEAEFDRDFDEQENPDPFLPPQSHIVNARRNETYNAQNGKSYILGNRIFQRPFKNTKDNNKIIGLPINIQKSPELMRLVFNDCKTGIKIKPKFWEEPCKVLNSIIEYYIRTNPFKLYQIDSSIYNSNISKVVESLNKAYNSRLSATIRISAIDPKPYPFHLIDFNKIQDYLDQNNSEDIGVKFNPLHYDEYLSNSYSIFQNFTMNIFIKSTDEIFSDGIYVLYSLDNISKAFILPLDNSDMKYSTSKINIDYSSTIGIFSISQKDIETRQSLIYISYDSIINILLNNNDFGDKSYINKNISTHNDNVNNSQKIMKYSEYYVLCRYIDNILVSVSIGRVEFDNNLKHQIINIEKSINTDLINSNLIYIGGDINSDHLNKNQYTNNWGYLDNISRYFILSIMLLLILFPIISRFYKWYRGYTFIPSKTFKPLWRHILYRLNTKTKVCVIDISPDVVSSNIHKSTIYTLENKYGDSDNEFESLYDRLKIEETSKKRRLVTSSSSNIGTNLDFNNNNISNRIFLSSTIMTPDTIDYSYSIQSTRPSSQLVSPDTIEEQSIFEDDCISLEMENYNKNIKD
ncbi:hypothetical protein cand_001920 [Cryptosporidium andersoni]|uniref:Peptidase M14 domain-containing protein n=1 Tax=Cryptosporidium andersoni TaxID=117008 RepID=A0A1J4MQF8_9CRYT|nr:hypothetical protein cand_001920 [Cryptosporidium andersoni]